MKNEIIIKGARAHNLKSVDLAIPKNKLVVFTGVSGSGKSSLAFDTIYAEGQRRYVESLSTYARQFLGVMEKPDVDVIEGLSPAISIDQKTTSKNPRSTVGTVTEIYDYLRLLFARVGHPHCPLCGREIESQSLDQIVAVSLSLLKETAKAKRKAWFLVLSPLVVDRKGEFTSLFDNLKAKGFKRVRVDGLIKDISEEFVLIKTNKHTIEAVVDRISCSSKDLKNIIFYENLKSRMTDSLEQALKLSEGRVTLAEVKDKALSLPEFPKTFEDHTFSEQFACPVDNLQIPEIEPRTFSFNSPHGACPECHGIGRILKVDEDLVFSDEASIIEGGILPLGNTFEHDTWYSRLIIEVCRQASIDDQAPIKRLSEKEKRLLLEGTGDKVYKVGGTNRFGRKTFIYEGFEGVVNFLQRRYAETTSDYVRSQIEKFMREDTCGVCQGTRLKQEALSITINTSSIARVTSFSINQARIWFENLLKEKRLSRREEEIGKLILKEIVERLKFLEAVGLEYITLDRSAGSLSGGEAQRIRLASQIGSGLTGVLYVLDEPTIGLHQRDNARLINTLVKLRDLGNSVIVVEHDREMIESADYLIDFGPGAGKAGGRIVATGSPKQVAANHASLTGKFLAGKRKVKLNFNGHPRETDKALKLKGCHLFNLKGIDVSFPLGRLVTITGVSGSGKSTLLVETLYPALRKALSKRFKGRVEGFKELLGQEAIDKVILIDQSPIGRTPRSNPATYTGVFDPIREVFASTRDAKAQGYKKGRFSFNLKGGRCETCEGQGQIKIEMQFMSDLWVTCDTCKGRRYSAQTLEITYKGKNIAEVLDLTVSEAREFFHAHPKIMSKLDTLEEVGLGYIDLGQSATTLSGGEAQRVKLATELSKKATGKTLYILDEPTTGLHFADLEKLLNVLRLLVEKGNSVILIEHNLDVIKNSDWIIDLGPEGGDAGGRIVAQGTPHEIKKVKASYTGKYL